MGVDIETLKPGDGANFPKPGQKVHCHYVLTLTNGTKVDSSRDRGQPFSFSLGRGEVRYRPRGDTGLLILLIVFRSLLAGMTAWPRCPRDSEPS